jgi:predicted enzyme related to lactoylglutathione lyase
MTSVVQNIAFDCADPYALASFWSGVVDAPLSPDDYPGDPEASILMANGVSLFFNQVPEPKAVKNRVHVCLQPSTSGRDAEVERLLAIGAALKDDRRNEDGTGWAVLTDPEGNEFCVLRSAEERAAAAH